MAPPPVDSQPGHEEVPVTRAARAREVSVLGAVALYAFFLALVALLGARRRDPRQCLGAARQPVGVGADPGVAQVRGRVSRSAECHC
jgi:hypothetical protein